MRTIARRPHLDRRLTCAAAGMPVPVAVGISVAPARDVLAALVLVLAGATVALVVGENHRLETQLRSSTRQVDASRARIMAAADGERRRIERDLHDGAQQRLVALRITLELADEAVRTDPARGAALLEGVGAEVDSVLDEVRSLARGIYPSLLEDRGLGEALRAAALRAPLPASVAADGVRRCSPEIENAVYFVCLEAMQNAGKHASDASRLAVSISAGDDLRFEVTDDGPGFARDEISPGVGMANMRDRVAAVGGELTVDSAPGEGTCVSGRVPLPFRAAGALPA
jgi:signal transduction histidine kinase